MSAAMKLDAERAAFEAWAEYEGWSKEQIAQVMPNGTYMMVQIRCAWAGWLHRSKIAELSTPPQGELSALPELPPQELLCGDEAIGDDIWGYTEAQVRAYGLLCRQSGDAADKRDAGALDIAVTINKKLGEYIAGRTYLLPDDLAALKRFHECATDFDSGGHDVSKAAMARLREIGVVQSIGFGRHQTTAFGDYVLERAEGEPVKLPLKTLAERNADAAIAQRQEGGE